MMFVFTCFNDVHSSNLHGQLKQRHKNIVSATLGHVMVKHTNVSKIAAQGRGFFVCILRPFNSEVI